MLARWSRVTPGTCRCVSYVPRMATIAGRRGLYNPRPTSIPAVKIPHAAVFTASLSVDARATPNGDPTWEEAVARLHEALQRPPAASNTPQAPIGPEEDTEWRSTLNNASVNLAGDAALDELDAALLHASVDTWELVRLDLRLPGLQAPRLPASTGRDIEPYNVPPQSLWAADALRLASLRRRQTHKKLAVQGVAIGLLIHDLIRHVGLARFGKRINKLLNPLSPHIHRIMSASDTEAQKARTVYVADLMRLRSEPLESSAERFASLSQDSGRLGLPRYRQDIDGDFHIVADQLNAGITQLLDRNAQGSDAEKAVAVAKICHNLLVSTSAPNLHTFNVLIAGFMQWRQSTLVEDVIAALEPTKIRPNELLCAQILRYYANESLPENFTRFVALMRGVNDALMLANPAVTINEASAGRLEIEHGKVYQKVYPTPMVFEALIDGVMKFAGFDRALDVYYEMKIDGWGLTLPALTKLLANCIRHADWEAGTYIWEEINSIKIKVKPSYVAKAYHHMLSLCSVTGNTVAFNQILNEVANRGFDQKAIITAALKTTRWAQHKKDNLAPAWAADNLMIAVSGYSNDTKPSENATDKSPPDDLDDLPDTESDYESSEDELGQMGFLRPNTDTTIDKKEAWSSWVEHEFGEKPKDPEP